MGYDPEYFLRNSSNGGGGLDESLICVVCHSVYDSPMVLDPCGHSFCRQCVASLLDSGHEHCPVCRTRMIEGVGVGVPPNRALKELIGNLEIKCMMTNDQNNNNININNNTGDRNQQSQSHACSWTGKLTEFKSHSEKDCPLRRVSCPVLGCNWEGPRCELGQHNADGVALHTDLRIAAKLEQIQEDFLLRAGVGNDNTNNARIDELEQKLVERDREIKTLKARLLDNWLSDNFFRDWIVAKPPYFQDFCVYRPIQYLTGPISQIIVGIPGPRGTDWEEGLYPLLVTFTPEGYERKEPPKCDFPEDFFHPNVYEGNVHVNTLVEFEGLWDPSISLPELFFCVQQLLAHPNHRDSLSTSSNTGILYDPVQYRRKVRLQAKEYEYCQSYVDVNANDTNRHDYNNGSSEFLERAMVKLQSKIDPEYKKPLQSWENERWQNLEEVRWKGRRSFQLAEEHEFHQHQHQHQHQQHYPRISTQDQRRVRVRSFRGSIGHSDEHNNNNNNNNNSENIDGDEQVQIIMTTNSNDSGHATPLDNRTGERSTHSSSSSMLPITGTDRLRNDDGDVCECSCCLQGGAARPFLDREHRMRYIFGEGG